MKWAMRYRIDGKDGVILGGVTGTVVVEGDSGVRHWVVLGGEGRQRTDLAGVDPGLVTEQEDKALRRGVDAIDSGHDRGRTAPPVVLDLDDVEAVDVDRRHDLRSGPTQGHQRLVDTGRPDDVERGPEQRRAPEGEGLLRLAESAGRTRGEDDGTEEHGQPAV